MFIDDCIAVLRSHGIPLETGHSATELELIERQFGFEFSPDHRRFLQAVQPTGAPWLDWRHDSAESIRSRLDWPLDGVLFDVENNAFWPVNWPPRPETQADRVVIATERVKKWPALIPLYSHRYMPAAPIGERAPVFSVWQTDVIFYGDDLLDYFRQEFGPADPDYYTGRARTVSPETCPPWSLFPYEIEVTD